MNEQKDKIAKIISENTKGYVNHENMVTQLSQLFKTEMLSIIGEDWDLKAGHEATAKNINSIKAQQRSTLEERVKP